MVYLFVECHINFHGLFNVKAILEKRGEVVLSNLELEDKWVHFFPKDISPKVKVMAWLEFELTYYIVAV